MKYLVLVLAAMLASACSSVEKSNQVSQNTAAVEESVKRYPAMIVKTNEVPVASSGIELSKKVDLSREGVEDGFSGLIAEARHKCISRENSFRNEKGIFSDLSITYHDLRAEYKAKNSISGDYDSAYQYPVYKNKSDKHVVETGEHAMHDFKIRSLPELKKMGFTGLVAIKAICVTYKNLGDSKDSFNKLK